MQHPNPIKLYETTVSGATSYPLASTVNRTIMLKVIVEITVYSVNSSAT